MQIPLNQLFFVDHHVVPKIVETQLIVRRIRNITVVSSLTFLPRQAVHNHAYRKSQEVIDLSHPFTVTFCQIIIYRYQMHAFSFKCVQICRQSRHQRLSLTGFHLRNAALMQHNAADQLYIVVTLPQHAPSRLTHNGKRFRQQIIRGLAICQPFFEYLCHFTKLGIRFCFHGRFQRIDLCNHRLDLLYGPVAVASKKLFK